MPEPALRGGPGAGPEGTGREPAAAAGRRWVPVALWCALALMLAYRISIRVVDPDIFHQMAFVRESLAAGAFLRDDPYAFTPTLHPMVYHEWGAGVVAWVVATALGGGGILALKYVLAFAAGAVTIAAARLRPGAGDIAWAFAPFAILLADYGFSPVRAQAYSFLLAAATLWFVARDREGGRRWMVGCVALFVVWVNLHGGFVVGPTFLAAHCLEQWIRGRPWKHLAALLGVMLLAGALNPYGLRLYGSVWSAIGMERPLIDEWRPVWSRSMPPHQLAVLALSLAAALYGFARRRWSRADGALILGVAAGLAVRHQRMLPFYAMAWLAILPGWLEGSPLAQAIVRLLARRPAVFGAAAAAVALLYGGMWLARDPWALQVPNEPRGTESPMSYPVQAVELLRASRFRGNLLTPFEQGAYVSWKLYPAVKVSLDSRYEATYPGPVVDELLRFYMAGEGIERVLQEYGADLLLVPNGSALARKAIPWRRVHADAGFALYARPGLELRAPPGTSPAGSSFP